MVDAQTFLEVGQVGEMVAITSTSTLLNGEPLAKR